MHTSYMYHFIVGRWCRQAHVPGALLVPARGAVHGQVHAHVRPARRPQCLVLPRQPRVRAEHSARCLWLCLWCERERERQCQRCQRREPRPHLADELRPRLAALGEHEPHADGQRCSHESVAFGFRVNARHSVTEASARLDVLVGVGKVNITSQQ